MGLALLVAGALLLVVPRPRHRVVSQRLWHSQDTLSRFRRKAPDADLLEVLTAMRDELLAGAGLRMAFEHAVESAPPSARLAGALATCRMGGDVPEALRRDADAERLLMSLAALWQVCEDSGAAVAAALDRLLQTAAATRKVRNEIAAQLAGPRATARVLAVLPLVGVGMGLLMGADPLGFVFGSPWGWGCLIVAGALEAVGIAWIRRLVSSIESQL